MADETGDEPEPIELKNAPLAALLAWLIPGLGHLYQGRFGKAALFAVCINGLFWYGMAQSDYLVVWFRWDKLEWRYYYPAQVGVGLGALPALVPEAVRGPLPEPARSFELPPSEEALDELNLRRGKRVEVARVYTTVAGLLNMLVIYDALAGPALWAEERARRRRNKAGPTPSEGSDDDST